MHAVEKYVNAIMTHNPEVMANIFTEDAYFEDHAPRQLGGSVAVCRGRKEIFDFFTGLFAGAEVKAELVVTFARRGLYDVRINGKIVKCKGTVVEENGKIKELIVEPR